MDLLQGFDRLGIEYKRKGQHHHATRGWLSIDCPFCSPNSKRYRLGIQISSGRANCYVCGALYAPKTLEKVVGGKIWEIWHAIDFICIQLKKPDLTGILDTPIGIGEMGEAHRQYLKRRGFNPDLIASLWSVQGIGLAKNLQWRLYIPIHDEFGRQVSWTTRSLSDEVKSRYISAKAEQEARSLKSVLYGAHLARSAVVVTEGPLDAWAIGAGAVATLGMSVSHEQTALIAGYLVRAICFDSTPDAQRRAEALCTSVSAFPGQTHRIILESGDDPAEADPAEIADIRSQFLDF
jgi:hypothetical protein